MTPNLLGTVLREESSGVTTSRGKNGPISRSTSHRANRVLGKSVYDNTVKRLPFYFRVSPLHGIGSGVSSIHRLDPEPGSRTHRYIFTTGQTSTTPHGSRGGPRKTDRAPPTLVDDQSRLSGRRVSSPTPVVGPVKDPGPVVTNLTATLKASRLDCPWVGG